MDDRSVLAQIRDIVGRENTLDDCAVFSCGDLAMVATTDMVHETTDFPAGMTDWQRGWMSAAVTISDIASMGAAPQYVLAAVGLDRWERLRPIMLGVRDCCQRYGASVVGGDIDRHAELTVVTTGLGTVDPAHLVRRQGAKVGDLVCVTGTLGGSQAALEGYRQHERHLFEPMPRVAEGQILGRSGATSMMDISDGLALSLYDMMEANACGYRIDAASLPLAGGVPEAEARELALYGGGDFELLFTYPADRPLPPEAHAAVIGRVIERHEALLDGVVIDKRGYLHRW